MMRLRIAFRYPFKDFAQETWFSFLERDEDRNVNNIKCKKERKGHREFNNENDNIIF